MITLAHNLAAMNIQRQLGINNKKQNTCFERLASGYKINRAADDAAGLAISEKLRHQIRGLNQGTQNAQDGISWLQIGDGALNEVDDMLHRMTELTIQSLNDTYTDEDRAAMEAEFNELQSQIDHITENTKFNEKNIFSEHEPTYYQLNGNAVWPHEKMHEVNAPDNTLVISYRENKDDEPATVTITVPEGEYTTQELADEIEDAIAQTPLAVDPRLNLEFTEDGTFNANLEGGAKIETVGGHLSYLLYDLYEGGAVGALIGTTVFSYDDARLPIATGKNDHMDFVIEDFSGNITHKTLTLSPGAYTRDELIDILNNKLSDTTVKATKYGTGIMLSSDDCIISQFKGNMFQIDGPTYTSVFYDNVYHGEVALTPGKFTGGAVLTSSSYANGKDVEHSAYEIKAGVNDTLTFKPDRGENEVTITIPEGRYENGAMVAKLNELFNSNGLGLTATSTRDGDFSGIEITSKLRGATSDVGVDSTSSAYDTLFVNKTYNEYESRATVTNELQRDSVPYFRGGKSFTNSSYNNLPIEIVENQNDSFILNIDGTGYTVKLTPATYTSAEGVRSAVQNVINTAVPDSLKNKINVNMYDGSVYISPQMDARIVNITASKASGNNGYEDIFTTSYKINEKTITNNNATLDGTFPDPTSISSPNNRIVVESTDGNAVTTIDLPTGDNITHQDIIDAIERVPENVVSVAIVNTPSISDGRDYNFSISADGTTTPRAAEYKSQGVTEGGGIEGQVGGSYTTNTPASIRINFPSSGLTPGTGTDELKLTINGVTETFTFDHNVNYTPTTFAAALQDKIDRAFGNVYKGAKVEVSGNSIKVTARLVDEYGMEQPASSTNIYCSTDTSSLLKEINTTRTSAQVTTPANNLLPASGINVSAGDTFLFKLNGETKTVRLKALSNGSGADFANMLNQCLAEQGIKATATAGRYGSGYRMTLTSQTPGQGNTISYDSNNGGSVSSKIYPNATTAGYATSNKPVQENVTIENGKNEFRYSSNGTEKVAYLTPGTYTRQTLVDELNRRLVGATASINSNGILTLTSTEKGSNSSVSYPYNTSPNSAMRAIWGTQDSKVPKLNASFDDNDHLVLTSSDGTRFRIRSSQNSFVEANKTARVSSPGSNSGYYSTQHATMDGGDLVISSSKPLVIDEWNDELKFNYFRVSNPTQAVSIILQHGNYESYDQLKDELQSKLDSALGSGEVTVSVDEHGVVIQAVRPGFDRAFGSVGYTGKVVNPPVFGDFYDKVMNGAVEKTVKLSPTSTPGSNVAGTDKLPYTTGRRNIKDTPVTIKKDVNDVLTLDFAYTDENGVPRENTFNMKLDTGTYQGDDLAKMIQEKLNEELTKAGLPENFIEVKVGGTNAVVAGVDNDKVLTFMLSNSLPLPSAGEYVIDGIGGNAAFSIFYQTMGDLVPAYIEGAKNISEGVVIDDDNNKLEFKTDGNTYSLEIPPGTYTKEEIIDKLNELLNAQNAPVKAEETEDGRVKIAQKKMGDHPITELNGSARGTLFFNEGGEEDAENFIKLQLSSREDDNKQIERPLVNTTFLGINTVGISKPKYANKAINRLKEAMAKVADVRSYFGTTQNEVEHIVNRNNTAAENTEAADSRIRDTDVAAGAMALANQNAVKTVGESMLVRVNKDRNHILNLLK